MFFCFSYVWILIIFLNCDFHRFLKICFQWKYTASFITMIECWMIQLPWQKMEHQINDKETDMWCVRLTQTQRNSLKYTHILDLAVEVCTVSVITWTCCALYWQPAWAFRCFHRWRELFMWSGMTQRQGSSWLWVRTVVACFEWPPTSPATSSQGWTLKEIFQGCTY